MKKSGFYRVKNRASTNLEKIKLHLYTHFEHKHSKIPATVLSPATISRFVSYRLSLPAHARTKFPSVRKWLETMVRNDEKEDKPLSYIINWREGSEKKVKPKTWRI